MTDNLFDSALMVAWERLARFTVTVLESLYRLTHRRNRKANDK